MSFSAKTTEPRSRNMKSSGGVRGANQASMNPPNTNRVGSKDFTLGNGGKLAESRRRTQTWLSEPQASECSRMQERKTADIESLCTQLRNMGLDGNEEMSGVGRETASQKGPSIAKGQRADELAGIGTWVGDLGK